MVTACACGARFLGMAWLKRMFDLRWFDDHSECGLGCARAAQELSVHG